MNLLQEHRDGHEWCRDRARPVGVLACAVEAVEALRIVLRGRHDA